MSSVAILIIFCAIAFCSIVAVSVVNQRQRRARIMGQKLRQMKRRVDDLQELVTAVDQLVESRAIAKLINDEVIYTLRAMQHLDPGASYLDAARKAAEQRADALSNEAQQRQLYRLQDSDAQIARSQRQLNEAGRLLRRQHAEGYLSIEELEAFMTELSWSHLQVEVISVVVQGHKALNKGDVVTAHAYYRKARQSLIRSQHSDPRRQRMIREISELLNRRRRFISPDLMPESQYNPKPLAKTTAGELEPSA